MSDRAPQEVLLPDWSSIDVDAHCRVVRLIRDLIRDRVGYFTKLSINCDDVADGNDGSCGNRNRTVVTELETIKMV